MKLRDRLKVAYKIALRLSDEPSYVLVGNLPAKEQHEMKKLCDKVLDNYKEELKTITRVSIDEEEK